MKKRVSFGRLERALENMSIANGLMSDTEKELLALHEKFVQDNIAKIKKFYPDGIPFELETLISEEGFKNVPGSREALRHNMEVWESLDQPSKTTPSEIQ